MTAADVGVIVGGLAAIAAVNWWFFIAGRDSVGGGKRGDATPD